MTATINDIETRLRHEKLHEIEADVARKRLRWFETRNWKKEDRRPTPRDAYELFLLDYLGLPEDQVPVVHESETEITWLSKNSCATLDACRELGLDTRTVCRGAYEKSTQLLLSQLDPQLRFVRDYEEIRPHAPHCKESIVRVDFEALIQTAGSGAIITCGEKMVSRARDIDESHAAAEAIRQAIRTLGESNLCGAILVSTYEPCPSCTSLAIQSNLTSIIYEGPRSEAPGCRDVIYASRHASPVTIEVVEWTLR